ncbi:hypothetical protein [Kitasatospora aureofaciens]|uniref:hypothetical protein n=1 Tax=Kitasatospora aureofaciens TaxID=1894 RepID=UPI001C450021|nr:hypothetical protein [Kitasatospora aureofaciens]MBV6702331.1 hypothetical protein [Kitasatospora aureofaciens]
MLDAAGLLDTGPARALPDHRSGDDAVEILTAAGWKERTSYGRVSMSSPIGSTHISREPSLPERPLFFLMNNTSSEHMWEIHLSPWAPAPLVRRTAEQLATGTALRHPAEIPAHHRARVTTESAPSTVPALLSNRSPASGRLVAARGRSTDYSPDSARQSTSAPVSRGPQHPAPGYVAPPTPGARRPRSQCSTALTLW